MTTSNSTNFTLTRDEISTHMLMSTGRVRPGGTATTADLTFCGTWLNLIVKAWEAQGIHMWKRTEGTLFLLPNINQYTITGSGNIAGTNTKETNLTAAASSTALTVTSTYGMTAADQIGIELDNGTRQWTTIVSVNSTTSLTITTGVTSAASTGNTIFTYTTECQKPMHVSSARFRTEDGQGGVDRPLYIKGIDEFKQIPQKQTTGLANQMTYTAFLNTGVINLWPTPDTIKHRVEFSYIQMLQDFDSSSDNADFPVEWLECLILTLKDRTSMAYGLNKEQRLEIKQDAQQSLIEMQLWDMDNGSTRIVPNYRDDR